MKIKRKLKIINKKNIDLKLKFSKISKIKNSKLV